MTSLTLVASCPDREAPLKDVESLSRFDTGQKLRILIPNAFFLERRGVLECEPVTVEGDEDWRGLDGEDGK